MTLKITQKGFSKIAVIIIIAVVALAGWWYWGQKFSPTAGWQTYRNEQFGFEFRYPDDYVLTVLDRPQDTLSPIVCLRSPDFESHDGVNYELCVLRFNDNTNRTIRQYYELLSVGGNWYKAGYTPRNITVDGYDAVRFDNVKDVLSSIPVTEVTIKVAGRFFAVRIEGTAVEKISVFNQILSTFKFIK